MTRRKFTASFKAKVVLEALKERKSLSELAQQYELHPNQISKWKQEFLQGADQVFKTGVKNRQTPAEQEKERLLRTIGELKVENDFLKNALR
ncbi:MAG: transposase [Bacteroidetes bacterium]|nr:transposase [Bacteroidota bacterium]